MTTCLFISCKQTSVNGIVIGSELYEYQSISDNNKLCSIIKRALQKDEKALLELGDFWCGGGAGCYDLGYVLSQIVNRIGEKEFIKLTASFTQSQKGNLLSLITAGLEYGDNNYDDKMDDATIIEVYPDLAEALAK